MSIKLGYSTLPWKGYKIDEILSQIKKPGFSGVELNQIEDLATPEEIKELAAQIGLEITGYTIGGIELLNHRTSSKKENRLCCLRQKSK